MAADTPAVRDSPHRFLRGNYAPVREEVTLTDLAVTGTIPDYLDGRYLRIGPNPIDPDPATYEWFLGEGMAHGLRLSGGRAEWYRNRWVRSATVARALGEPWPGGGSGAGLDFAANTNIVSFAGNTLALVEAGPRPYALSDDLTTLGGWDFHGTLTGGYAAHPALDPATGELHAVSYGALRGNHVRYLVAGPDGRIRRSVDIPTPGGPLMHDFALTQRYVVFYDLPVIFDVGALARTTRASALTGLAGRALSHLRTPGAVARRLVARSERPGPPGGFPYRWDPARPARLLVMPRDGGARDVRAVEIDQCFVYHTLGAYDEVAPDGTDRIVIDVARHDTAFAGGIAPFAGSLTLDRWTVDPARAVARSDRLDDRRQEFPRIDDRLVGRAHRFGYTVGEAGSDGDSLPNTVLRHDLSRGTSIAADLGADAEPGEVVFVPRTPDAAEDDGVVMGFVHHRATDTSSLEILDAATLGHVASVALPVRVPHGFHGNWAPTP